METFGSRTAYGYESYSGRTAPYLGGYDGRYYVQGGTPYNGAPGGYYGRGNSNNTRPYDSPMYRDMISYPTESPFEKIVETVAAPTSSGFGNGGWTTAWQEPTTTQDYGHEQASTELLLVQASEHFVESNGRSKVILACADKESKSSTIQMRWL
ncbi:unnamed protein product [Clonostachys rosea]|uniref:Ig-like domain-containing protein n=1 Tax=Bionectria ochroleuca TaxID=29856 RepID=A0ABY6U805_BIOOC|nr:unnamed protein product [Clonostachys rosea]